MDYLSLKAAVAEASKKLSGTKISDAWQTGRNEVVLLGRKGPGLVLSIEPAHPGLFLLDRDHLPERDVNPFTDLLRARIKGTTLGEITVPEPGERIVHVTAAAAWPAKKDKPLTIVLEVMGRRSNLMVLEEDRIIQPLRTVPAVKSPARPVMGGEQYVPPPPQAGIAIEDLTAEDSVFTKTLPDAGELRHLVRGLSPYTASQAITLAASSSGKTGLYQALSAMAASCTGEMGFLHDRGGKLHLVPFEPVPDPGDEGTESFEPFSAASARWRDIVSTDEDAGLSETGRLERGLKQRLSHIDASLVKLNAEREKCTSHDEFRVMAETLLIHTGQLPPGSESVTLPDPYDPGLKITISLDPSKSPQDNANELFTRARRLKRGLEETEARQRKLQAEREEVSEALKTLTEHGDPEPAEKIFPAGTDLRVKGGKHRQPVYGGPGRRYYVEGFTILVGKSSTDNEKVTFTAAGPSDLWLHARDYPGSHVVIITNKRHVPDEVLYKAANLAAAGSGARNDTAPEIMVTERKWVKKLKGGKPGQVTVERFRTIRPRM